MVRIGKRTFGDHQKVLQSRHFASLLLGLATMIALLVVIAAARNFSIVEDGTVLTVVTTGSADVETVCNMAGITLCENDEVTVKNLNARYAQIHVKRAFDVTVTCGEETMVASVTGGTVADVFRNLNIAVDDNDILSAELSDSVSAGMYIDLISVDYETITLEETIAAGVDTRYTNDLPSGEVQVTAGSDGVKRITCSQKSENGVVTECLVLSEEIISAPVNAVNLVGTGIQTQAAVPASAVVAEVSASSGYGAVNAVSPLQPGFAIELDENNRPVQYKQKLTGKATAYCTKGTTATGKRAQVGYVAVDPKEIPYGSQLYIITSDGSIIYGYAVAEDTGGFTKNSSTLIDLFYNTRGECISFGRRNVEVYILN